MKSFTDTGKRRFELNARVISMQNHKRGFIVPLLLIIVAVLIISGIYYFNLDKSTTQVSQKNIPSSSVFRDTIPNYIFSDILSKNLVDVTLSHHSISFKSPFGVEKSFKGSMNLVQYLFSSGVRMTVSLNTVSPKDELKELILSSDGQQQYDSFFQFIESKIGSNFSSYDFLKFVYNTNQSTVDNATATQDKEGYTNVLSVKRVLPFTSDNIYEFQNKNGKGFVYIENGSIVPKGIDFWTNDSFGRYSFLFPTGQNISRENIDDIIKSLKGTTASTPITALSTQ